MGRGARQLVPSESESGMEICISTFHPFYYPIPRNHGFRTGVLHILVVCNMKGWGQGMGIYKEIGRHVIHILIYDPFIVSIYDPLIVSIYYPYCIHIVAIVIPMNQLTRKHHGITTCYVTWMMGGVSWMGAWEYFRNTRPGNPKKRWKITIFNG